MKRDPRTYHAIKMERYPNAELNRQSRSIRAWLEKSKVAHAILKILAVFGVSLIIADGILTPAQSVLGAIQGLKVVDDSIGSPTIIGVSCAILVLLFVLQPLGIQKLASCFAPIVILWLLFNMSFGIYVSSAHSTSLTASLLTNTEESRHARLDSLEGLLPLLCRPLLHASEGGGMAVTRWHLALLHGCRGIIR